MLVLRFKPYTLQLKYPFGIAGNTRTTTPIVLTELEYDGVIGYGEASLPPYLGETQESVQLFLSQLSLNHFSPFEPKEILIYVNNLLPGNTAAKASVDIALHDLFGKLNTIPCYKMFGANPALMPKTSITIGIDTEEVIAKKVNETIGFDILKVKLGSADDKKIINAIRKVTNKALSVDVNQGWKDKHFALEMIHWLNEQNVLFVEQPMPKEMLNEISWLRERSPLPIIADESIQRLSDLDNIKNAYHGINIKLMKCAGMYEAKQLIDKARENNLKILIGCMNESSCANMAAAQLAPLADWVDLDGPFLINNNPFKDPEIRDGKIVLSELSGIGLEFPPTNSI